MLLRNSKVTEMKRLPLIGRLLAVCVLCASAFLQSARAQSTDPEPPKKTILAPVLESLVNQHIGRRAVVKVVHDHEGAAHHHFMNYKILAMVAVLYCLWAIWGGDPITVVHAMVALLFSVPLYPFFMRSMAAARQRKQAASSTSN